MSRRPVTTLPTERPSPTPTRPDRFVDEKQAILTSSGSNSCSMALKSA